MNLASLDPMLAALSYPEKLELIGLLWDSIPDQDVPITQWERELLDQRIAEYEADPDEGQSLEEFLKELESDEPLSSCDEIKPDAIR